jgi:hypothetical protein
MKRSEFTITCKRDGVFLTVGDKCIRVADPIRVRSIGTRLADKVTLFEIKFETIDGDTRSETFPFSYLHRERWDKIKVRVGDQGYVWPEDRHVSDEILRQLAAERPKRRFVQVSAPGWYQPAFVLPGKVYGPPGSGTDYRIDPDSDAHVGAFACGKGSVEGWQEAVAKPARKSSCLRVAIAAAFAAPLLGPMAILRDQLVQRDVGWQDSHALYRGVCSRSDRPRWFARMGRLGARNGGSSPRSPGLRFAAG